jgi:hypothetical protein
MTVNNARRDATKRSPSIVADGRRVRLADLPLVAYTLACSHLGRDYAIAKGDQVFCTDCGTHRRVATIIA